MGQVTITLNGRSYKLRCGDGEEARLLALADHVQTRLTDLTAEFGPVGDERILVMAALMIADELFDARDALAAAGQSAGTPPAADAIVAAASVAESAPLMTHLPLPSPDRLVAQIRAGDDDAPPADDAEGSLSRDPNINRGLRRPEAPVSFTERRAEAREAGGLLRSSERKPGV